MQGGGVLSRSRDCSSIVPALGDISNDAGEVKTHLLRSGRRSRLSTAKESAEAAVPQAVRVGDVHPFTLALFTVSPVVPTKHLFGHNGP